MNGQTIKNTSIGFEFQTNQLSLLECISYEDDPLRNYLTYYKTKRVFHLVPELISVYGDVTNPAFEDHVNQLYQELKKQSIKYLQIIDQKNSFYDVHVDETFIDFFNEAEFLVTFADPDPRLIPLTKHALIEWIIEKTRESSIHLTNYLESLEKLHIRQVMKMRPTRTRDIDIKDKFGYSILFSDPKDPKIKFPGRFDIPIRNFPFRVQTTIGLELHDVLPVLLLLQEIYEELPKKSDQYTDECVEAFPTIQKEVLDKLNPRKTNERLYIISVLLLYMERTKLYRKHALFVIRHLQRDLIGLLNKKELNSLHKIYPHSRILLSNYQEIHKDRQTINEYHDLNLRHIQMEKMNQVGFFPVSNSDVRILIEIRMVDVLLLNALSKGRKRHVQGLQKDLDPYSLSLSELLFTHRVKN